MFIFNLLYFSFFICIIYLWCVLFSSLAWICGFVVYLFYSIFYLLYSYYRYLFICSLFSRKYVLFLFSLACM